MRKYVLNESFFDKIDSGEKAYFLGFMLSDGCVSGKYAKIQLQDADVNILEKFKNALCYGGPILHHVRKSDCRSYALLQLHSQHLVDSLNRLGVVERKCFITKAPDLNDDVKRHFWRGMIDGDGSIFTQVREGRDVEYSIELAGTKEVCESFSDFLRCSGVNHNREVIGFKKEGHHTGMHYAFRLKAKLARESIRVLYSDANVFLDRKMILAKEAMDFVPKGISDNGKRRSKDSKLLFWKENREKMMSGINKGWSGESGDLRRKLIGDRIRASWMRRKGVLNE